MYTKLAFRTASALAFAIGTGQLLGCGNLPLVQGSAQVASVGQALLLQAVVGVKGTYVTNTCLDPAGTGGAKRLGGVAWASTVGPNPGQPVVVQSDPTCQLNITELDITDSGNKPAVALPAQPLGLAATYGQPVLFSYLDSGTGQPANFYANANLTPANFSTHFSISVLYSDTQSAVSPISLNGTYATVVPNTVSAVNVPTPDYQLSFAGVTYTKDRNGIVARVSGAPTLTAANQAGQTYVISNGRCPTTLAMTSAAFAAGQQVMVETPPTSASFGLAAGLALPAERCMIIANCGATSVCSYQLYQVAFN